MENNEVQEEVFEIESYEGLEIYHEIFRQLIKNSFDMIVLLDAKGNQHYVSESCEKILGFKPDELTHVPVIETMLHPDDRENARKGFIELIRDSNPGGTQYRHRHKNGGWVYLEAFGTNQLDNPLIKSVVLNVRDITERKEAEQALKKSETRLQALNATKDRLLSIIGHDLKNPFSSILGFSELLTAEIQKKNYDDAEEFAKIIQHSSKQAVDLLNNLIVWAQSQTGKIEYQPESFLLDTVARELIELLLDACTAKSITIHNKISKATPLFADKTMITLIIRNLLSNAIKFTKPSGEITLEATKNDSELTVSVTDNGIGIKKSDLNKLFCNENGKTHSTEGTLKESGTGLGLLLCKDFIEMHGGKIWVESQPKKGSVFTFSIPIREKP
ncbi:PAS domain-containing sensor histidine kinase [Rhodohalobacter sp. 614A]|uniref:PAS domain-containing sensor histidine kinase n=1 Tax=Rhodohalobacter sp. 614A TaxID=2908649 RepID=UPI001F15EAA1|nr:PAS domain-containing sensor histidine kinase [Rhodohalobacter sp. 614A]